MLKIHITYYYPFKTMVWSQHNNVESFNVVIGLNSCIIEVFILCPVNYVSIIWCSIDDVII